MVGVVYVGGLFRIYYVMVNGDNNKKLVGVGLGIFYYIDVNYI